MLCLAASTYLFPFVRVLFRVGDEGSIVYPAQLVAQGAVPYRDFFIENIGPGSFYFLAAFFKLFGITWVAARFALLLTGVSTAVLVFWMTRRVYSGAFSILPPVLVLVTEIPSWTAASHHWDSNLFGLLSVAVFFLWQERRRDGLLLLAGALAGVTSCFMQQKGLLICLGLLAALPWVCCGQRPLKRSIALLAAGYALTGTVVVALFLFSGGLSDLIRDTVLWPLTTYHGINRVVYGRAFGDMWRYWGAVCGALLPPAPAAFARLLLLTPTLIVVAIPVLLLSLGVFSRFVDGGSAGLFGPLALPYWTAGAGLWLSELHRPDVFHLVFSSPLLLIVCFHAWNVCLARLHTVRTAAMVFAGVSMLVWGVVIAIPTLNAHPVVTRRGPVYLQRPDAALAFLHQHLHSGEEAFVYPYYPMYYFLADLRNPTRHTIMLYNLQTREQFRAAIASLEKKKVRYVLWDTLVEDRNMKFWFPYYQSPPPDEHWMERYLEARYVLEEVKNGFRIMRRKDDATVPDSEHAGLTAVPEL